MMGAIAPSPSKRAIALPPVKVFAHPEGGRTVAIISFAH